MKDCYVQWVAEIYDKIFLFYTLHVSRPLKGIAYGALWASLVAQRLKRLPPMQETQVRSLGWEDPLEKEMATHSSTLAWKNPTDE